MQTDSDAVPPVCLVAWDEIAHGLIDTGVAGRPRSYFNPIASYTARMQRLLKDASDDENYLGRVVVAATTENGDASRHATTS